jgi:hypothetical protein
MEDTLPTTETAPDATSTGTASPTPSKLVKTLKGYAVALAIGTPLAFGAGSAYAVATNWTMFKFATGITPYHQVVKGNSVAHTQLVKK